MTDKDPQEIINRCMSNSYIEETDSLMQFMYSVFEEELMKNINVSCGALSLLIFNLLLHTDKENREKAFDIMKRRFCLEADLFYSMILQDEQLNDDETETDRDRESPRGEI